MDVKKIEYRRLRGVMLKMLAGSYPGPMDAMVLHFKIRELGFDIPENELVGIEAYLEEKGYVVRETRSATAFEIRMIRVTALGLDVLDGSPVDPGVETKF